MKKATLILFLILANINLYAQIDEDGGYWGLEVDQFTFEKQAPLYILQNYWSPTGLTDIIKAAKLDDRVGGINTKNQNDPENPEISIKYYNNIIVFEKNKTRENLGTFRIYFKNQEDLNLFTANYAWAMGFIGDSENLNRFYSEKGPMNAVIKNSIQEKNIFYAVCFVYQGLWKS